MGKNTVTITDNRTGNSAEFPIREGTHGPSVMDISGLYKQLGMFTYDPGFLSTASCESKITFIDGEKGILLYRGYPIDQLAENSTFLEVCYLLLYGDLPTKEQFEEFNWVILHHSMIHESLKNFYNGFRQDAHPMAIMVGVVGALSAFYHDSLDIHDPQSREISAHRLIAKMPTIAANSYRYAHGLPFNYPDNTIDYTADFIKMMWSVPSEPYEVNPLIAKALDVIFILHADHEQNASTSTVRLAGSSQANPFACVSAGIGTLWGPSHGGANEAVLDMLNEIGDVKNIPKAIERAKDKNDPFRLMGFGHRVYKNYDPRAKIIRKMSYEVLSNLGMKNNPLFEVALKLEEIALNDDFFVERKLYPNVDFYSGIIQTAIGIPTNMFTVIFAIARTVGWISQWMEMIDDPSQRIGRPRQTYIGAATKDYVPVDKREKNTEFCGRL